jgi:hypothetical protein
VNDVDAEHQITESIPVIDPAPEPAAWEGAGESQPGVVSGLLDPERPEKAVAAAFAGGLLFARLLRRVRS